jgi:hypothetical protein
MTTLTQRLERARRAATADHSLTTADKALLADAERNALAARVPFSAARSASTVRGAEAADRVLGRLVRR